MPTLQLKSLRLDYSDDFEGFSLFSSGSRTTLQRLEMTRVDGAALSSQYDLSTFTHLHSLSLDHDLESCDEYSRLLANWYLLRLPSCPSIRHFTLSSTFEVPPHLSHNEEPRSEAITFDFPPSLTSLHLSHPNLLPSTLLAYLESSAAAQLHQLTLDTRWPIWTPEAIEQVLGVCERRGIFVEEVEGGVRVGSGFEEWGGAAEVEVVWAGSRAEVAEGVEKLRCSELVMRGEQESDRSERETSSCRELGEASRRQAPSVSLARA